MKRLHGFKQGPKERLENREKKIDVSGAGNITNKRIEEEIRMMKREVAVLSKM